jgi:hypothetical protein
MSFEQVNPFAQPVENKTRIERENYTLRLLPGAKDDLPPEFIDKAYEFALANGKKLKHTSKTDTGSEGVNEIVWKMTDQDGYSFVLKLINQAKCLTRIMSCTFWKKLISSDSQLPSRSG